MVGRKQVNSSRKDGISHKLLFKIKGKDILISYWFQSFHFFKGPGKPRIKVKETTARMDIITSTMMLHNHVDGTDTNFSPWQDHW